MLEFIKRILVSTVITSMVLTPLTQAMESLNPPYPKNYNPKNYKKWIYLQHIKGHGGGDGVHLFKNPKNDLKVVVKAAKNKNHFIEEIIGRNTYKIFGHLVPQAHILDRTSSFWPKTGKWAEIFGEAPRVQICELIEVGSASKGKLTRWFDVLFGNFDLAEHNYIINKEGIPVPIDFGCFGRFRANGDRKLFEDLWAYKFIPSDQMVPPTLEELTHFKNHIPAFFESLMDLHRQFNIPDFPSLWNILASRLHSFLTIFDGQAPVYNADRPAVEGKMAGGVLLMTSINSKPHFLLGKRKQDGCLSDLGGLSTARDRTVSRTGWRECIEELGGFIHLDHLSILNAPFIDYQGPDVLYRMHLLEIEEPFSIETLNHHINSQKVYQREHLDFQWLPLDELLTLNTMHGPMKELLSQEHALQILTNFAAGHRPRALKGNNPYMGQRAMGDYVYPVLNVELLPSQDLFARAAASRLIRAHQRVGYNIQPLNLPLTASEAFLRLHLEDNYVEEDFIGNLKTLLKQKSDYFKSRQDELDFSLPFLEHILSQETLYPNHLSCLHGSEGHFGLLWLFGDIIRSEFFLQDADSIRTLRLFENAFEGVETLTEHFQSMEKTQGAFHGALDYERGGQARILSVNFSPLLSLGRESSESLSLFLRGDSVHPIDSPKAILEKFLEALKLPSMAINHFMLEMDPIFKSLEKCGALWQLFLPPEIANRYVYLSHPGGSSVVLNGQNEKDAPRNSPVEYLTTVRTDPNKVWEVLKKGENFNLVQGRILLLPEWLYPENSQGVHSNLFFSDRRDVSLLQETIRNLIQRILVPHLHLASASGAYSIPPRLVQLHNCITGTMRDEIPPQLAYMIAVSEKEGKSSQTVINLLEDPSVARLEVIDSLSLKRLRALELSTITSALADKLLQFHTSASPEGWSDRIKMLVAKSEKISEHFNKLGNPNVKGDNIGYLLTIDWENPEIDCIRGLTNEPDIHKLANCNSFIFENLGQALVILHSWGPMRSLLLPILESVGMVDYVNFISGTTQGHIGAIAFFNVILDLKDIDVGRIYRVINSLMKEKELRIKHSFAISENNFSVLPPAVPAEP
ncbi:MAG: hypothetical protein ACOH2E_02680 [Candidatus Paracaedibacter sp.]